MTKTTKALEIQKAISDEIVRGKRLPGTALDETILARDFGVSRTPIREAIRQLETTGLVEARPHRGALVCDIPPERLDDMFAVMTELEAICARWCAGRMSVPERRWLRHMHEESQGFVARDDREAYVEANNLFHDAVYDGTHNAFLAETTRHVRLRLSPFRRIQFEGAGRLRRSYDEHERILAAIESGDAGATEAEMRGHMGVVRETVEEITRPERPKRRQRAIKPAKT